LASTETSSARTKPQTEGNKSSRKNRSRNEQKPEKWQDLKRRKRKDFKKYIAKIIFDEAVKFF